MKARTRMIKPEFWDDEKLATVSRDSRLLFVGLWSSSYDYGVVKGHPAWMKNRIFPYDGIPLDIFEGWLAELAAIRVLVPFLHNGERYCHIRNFCRHQTINRPSGARNPAPFQTPEGDGGAPEIPPEEGRPPMTAAQCRLYEDCLAPLCPLDRCSLNGIWYSDEEICRSRTYGNLPWIKAQQKITRVKAEGYFTLEMLNDIRTARKGMTGLDPNEDEKS